MFHPMCYAWGQLIVVILPGITCICGCDYTEALCGGQGIDSTELGDESFRTTFVSPSFVNRER